MYKRVRTRFAPSPTGYMHIGNLRTALFAYLIAKKQDGDFILRIEDTDQERYVEGAVDVIYDTLRVAGLGRRSGHRRSGGTVCTVGAYGHVQVLRGKTGENRSRILLLL